MIVITGLMITDSLREISPNKIAVAYVGSDWKEYVDDRCFKEIVVSPTLGSNPRAIGDIASLLGWDNVHFLSSLHAKIYIGETMAAVGSFNLTANGLSGECLEEAGCLIDDKEIMAQLEKLFERYKTSAILEFPSKRSKIRKLRKLQSIWNKSVSEKMIFDNDGKILLRDYNPIADDDFYVVWTYGEAELNQDITSECEGIIGERTSVLANDQLKKNGWILCWKCNVDGLPARNSKPYWVAIDEVLDGGVNSPLYTKLVFERLDKVRPSYPFELGKNEILAIRNVLKSKKFPELLSTYSEVWSIAPTVPRFREFVEAIKTELRRINSLNT